MILLTLPYPPSVNHAYRTVRRRAKGGMIPMVMKTDKTNIFQAEVRHLVAKNQAGLQLQSRLSVTYIVCPPDRRRRDIANVEKVLTDALQYAGVFVDDEQIDELLIRRGSRTPGGCIFAEIRVIGGGEIQNE